MNHIYVSTKFLLIYRAALISIMLAFPFPFTLHAQSQNDMQNSPLWQGMENPPPGAQTGQSQNGQDGVSGYRLPSIHDGQQPNLVPREIITIPRPQDPGQVQQDMFNQNMDNLLPLTPEMIMELRRQFDARQRATVTPPPGHRPTPSLSSRSISLEPGGAPPPVRVSAGNVTVLTFFDMTGAAWPIEALVVGDPQSFSVEAPIAGGNFLTVTPLHPYAMSNIVVSLQGEPMPLLFSVNAGWEAVDYRIDFRVGGLGPNAFPSLIPQDPVPENGSHQLMRFLDGVPPNDAIPVDVYGGNARAWYYRDRLYLRTALTIISPAWQASVRGAGGMAVYEFADTPVVLASQDGQVISLSLH